MRLRLVGELVRAGVYVGARGRMRRLHALPAVAVIAVHVEAIRSVDFLAPIGVLAIRQDLTESQLLLVVGRWLPFLGRDRNA